MKRPYIANYSNKIVINNDVKAFYDQESQVSFENEEKTVKIIEKGKFGTTIETRVIESSDPDEVSFCSTTIKTFKTEDSDPDEFYELESTKFTKSMEGSDPDELCIIGTTKFTGTVEESDPDEYFLF